MSKSLLRRRLGLALVVAVTAGAGAAYATGAIGGGPQGVIFGCAKDQNGQLRIVQSPSECLPSEHPLAFQAPTAPPQQSFVVDCAAGEKLGDVLTHATAGVPLAISVKGTCTESVRIARDDVFVGAASAGAGIAAPAGSFAALQVDGAENVTLQALTLTGGQTGLSATGARFSAHQMRVERAGTGIRLVDSVLNLYQPTIEGSAENGIELPSGGSSVHVWGGAIRDSGNNAVGLNGGSAELHGVTVDGCGRQCISARFGAAAAITGGTVEHSANGGVDVFMGGDVNVVDGAVIQHNWAGVAAAGGTINLQGAIVRQNEVFGASASYGGSLVFQGQTVVEDNGLDGVMLSDGSSAKFQGGEVVRRSGRDGIHLEDTSVAEFENGDNVVVDNAGWGVYCQPAPGTAMVHVRSGIGTVSGNGAGEVSCPATP